MFFELARYHGGSYDKSNSLLRFGGCNVYIRNVICENYFEGGGWALVRRVAQGSTWHEAADNLAGYANYGTPSTADSLVSFSIPFGGSVTSTTELLFATGLVCVLTSED